MVFVPLRDFVVVLVTVLGPVGVSLLYKFLLLPFSYKLLYLLFQDFAIFCVMAVILVETAVFFLVTHVR